MDVIKVEEDVDCGKFISLGCSLCGINIEDSFDSKISHATKHLEVKPDNAVAGSSYTTLTEIYHSCFPAEKKVYNTNQSKQIICCCGKDFSFKKDLQRHENRVHLKLKPRACGFCGEPFCEDELKQHEEGKHKDIHLFPCEECDKKFKNNQKLKEKEEKTEQLTLKPFSCSICSRTFALDCNRIAHEKATHSNPKKPKIIQCGFCHKTFKFESIRKDHENAVHLKIKRNQEPAAKAPKLETPPKSKCKPFGCSFCPKTFAYDSFRKNHENVVHSDEEPFQCEVCQLRFKEEHERNVHLKAAHSTQKPVKEPQKCGRKRIYPLADGPYICKTCGRELKTEKTLNVHQVKIHNDKLPFVIAMTSSND